MVDSNVTGIGKTVGNFNFSQLRQIIHGDVTSPQNAYLFGLIGPLTAYYVQKGYTGDDLAMAVWRDVYTVLMGFNTLVNKAA